MTYTPKPGDRVTSPCVEHTGYRNAAGYGIVKREGRNWKAHRWAWTQANGPIPDGLFVLHRCDNPPCVNPDHLFLGDAAANAGDMVDKGRHPSQVKEACPQGHPLAEDNLYVYPRGWRRCRECQREQDRKYNAKRRAS